MIKIERANMEEYARRHFYRIMTDKKNSPGLGNILLSKYKYSRGARRDFFERLCELVGDAPTASILTMKPEQLQRKKNELNRDFATLLADKSFMKGLLKSVFVYKNYTRWGAYDLAKDLRVNVCPYCNRQYTFTINVANGSTRPQFDHFFDKATYPMFALSFYNLVPSCGICNSSFKNTDPFELTTHLHPYVDGFDDAVKFVISPLTVDFINGVASSYSIKVDTSKASPGTARRAKGNIKAFCILEAYNEHKDYVDEIIKKSRIYNKAYIRQLLNDWRGSLFISEKQIKQTIMANYLTVEDFDKRVLSKLTADICDHLKAFR